MIVFIFLLLHKFIVLIDGNALIENYRRSTVQGDRLPGDEPLLSKNVANSTECCVLCTITNKCELVTYDPLTRNCQLMAIPWMQIYDQAPAKMYFIKGYGMMLTVTKPETWEVAKNSCQKKGGRLLLCDTQEKLEHWKTVTSIFSEVLDAWIGLSNLETKADFQWIDGTSLNVTHEWQTGFPTDPGLEECVYGTKTHKWDVLNCNSYLPYTCEFVL